MTALWSKLVIIASYCVNIINLSQHHKFNYISKELWNKVNALLKISCELPTVMKSSIASCILNSYFAGTMVLNMDNLVHVQQTRVLQFIIYRQVPKAIRSLSSSRQIVIRIFDSICLPTVCHWKWNLPRYCHLHFCPTISILTINTQ